MGNSKTQQHTDLNIFKKPILISRGGGGHLQKGIILYWVWRDDRWLLVTKCFVYLEWDEKSWLNLYNHMKIIWR
jgi:hypothetical protein